MNKRRRLLINPDFQIRFILYLSAALMVGLLVLFVSNLYYFDHLITAGSDIGLHESHPYYEFIREQRELLITIYLGLSLFVFLGLMLFGLYLSHRIAGPIYRIEKYLLAVAADQADLQPVSLRETDFFPEIARIVNYTIQHVEDRHGILLTAENSRGDV